MSRWSVSLLAAVVLTVAGCAGESDQTVSPPASEPGAEVSAGQLDAALPAELDFTADLIGGGQLDGGDLEGRDVVLWFWAPW